MKVFRDAPARDTAPVATGKPPDRGLSARVGNRAFSQMVARSRAKTPDDPPEHVTPTHTVEGGDGGLVRMPWDPRPEASSGDTHQMSVIAGRSYEDMPTGEKRAIQQTAVMGVSPNTAAEALGLPFKTARSWEWLHLVAFSMRPTHVSSLSEKSKASIEKTGQPQQISENLVLGTAGANEVMLNYELAVKAILGEHRDWTADVWVAATVDERMILGPKDKPVVVPIGKWIDYHVMFRTPEGVVAPIVLAFDPTNHLAPPTDEHKIVADLLRAHVGKSVKADVHGMQTTGMSAVDE